MRQRGLTSPRRFNFYIDELIEELSGAQVGCCIDGKFDNNLSNADDLFFLAPWIRALRKVVKICDNYTWAHELRLSATN